MLRAITDTMGMRSFNFEYTSKTNTGFLEFTYENSISLVNM
jgi:hypothetical protein